MIVTIPGGEKIDIGAGRKFSVQLGHLFIGFFRRKGCAQFMAKPGAEICPLIHMPIIAIGWPETGLVPFFQSLN